MVSFHLLPLFVRVHTGRTAASEALSDYDFDPDFDPYADDANSADGASAVTGPGGGGGGLGRKGPVYSDEQLYVLGTCALLDADIAERRSDSWPNAHDGLTSLWCFLLYNGDSVEISHIRSILGADTASAREIQRTCDISKVWAW